MSKKRWSTSAWKKAEAIRGARRRRRSRPHGKGDPSLAQRVRQEKQLSASFRIVVLPPVFSLHQNPDLVLNFIKALREKYAAGQNVFQDFRKLTDIDSAAIALVAATIKFHSGICKTKGNLPDDPRCQEILLNSGILKFTDYESRLPTAASGIMFEKRASFKVEVKTAQSLVRHATKTAFGTTRRVPAAYRGLIEAMQNTFAHADKLEQGSEKWFAHVYADPVNKRAEFTFLDDGVGIFKSINIRPLKSLLRSLGVVENTQILQEILDRKIISSTGQTYRGRGLPSFQDAADRGTLKNMTIVSNDVYANLNQGAFIELKVPYEGTIIYWEI
jgi:hypothetical protein